MWVLADGDCEGVWSGVESELCFFVGFDDIVHFRFIFCELHENGDDALLSFWVIGRADESFAEVGDGISFVVEDEFDSISVLFEWDVGYDLDVIIAVDLERDVDSVLSLWEPVCEWFGIIAVVAVHVVAIFFVVVIG